MPWQQKLMYLVGQPIGISFMNGTGTSGVLCGTDGRQVFIIEYLYHSQFALKHYDYSAIQDIHSFPPCKKPQQPRY